MKVIATVVVDWFQRGGRGVVWYIKSLMGDTAYQNYLAHHHSRHPTVPPLTEREFWVARYRDQDASPTSRCC